MSYLIPTLVAVRIGVASDVRVRCINIHKVTTYVMMSYRILTLAALGIGVASDVIGPRINIDRLVPVY